MSSVPLAPSLEDEVAPETAAFYRRALRVLVDAAVPFLVGGAFAHACFTGIRRSTKDLDLFIRREDYERVASLMQAEGWRAELTYPHWLAKVYAGEDFIDLIFNSGNGVTPVDERWFRNNAAGRGAGRAGAPRQHRGRAAVQGLHHGARALRRRRHRPPAAGQCRAAGLAPDCSSDSAPHWRVLLAHLTLFGYIYPGERHRVPRWVMDKLIARLAAETRQPPAAGPARLRRHPALARAVPARRGAAWLCGRPPHARQHHDARGRDGLDRGDPAPAGRDRRGRVPAKPRGHAGSAYAGWTRCARKRHVGNCPTSSTDHMP